MKLDFLYFLQRKKSISQTKTIKKKTGEHARNLRLSVNLSPKFSRKHEENSNEKKLLNQFLVGVVQALRHK